MLLKKLNCEANEDIKKVKKAADDMEKSIDKLQKQEKKHSRELQTALAEFAEVRERAKEFDKLEGIDRRLAVRDVKKAEYYGQIEKKYGKHYYPGDAVASLAQADNMLGEDLPQTSKSIRWRLRIEQERIRRSERERKHKTHDDELEL